MTSNTFSLRHFAPPMTLRLIIINALMWLAQMILLHRHGIDLSDMLGMHYIAAESFSPLQLLSYMFLHSTSGIDHLFFNMFSLWMFGSTIERFWGQFRFLLFYVICGLTAALAQQGVWFFELLEITALPSDSLVQLSSNVVLPAWQVLDMPVTVGASGAVFGLLLAFGMLFPNSSIFLLFLPIPIKAKYFVVIYGLIELFLGVSSRGGGTVAHFAHLGGMIGGFLLILLWRKKGRIDGPYN